MWLLRPSLAWCFPACFLQPWWQCRFKLLWKGFKGDVRDFFNAFFVASVNIASNFSRKVSEETLGTFSALLCGFSVLHWHGVSLSGSHVLGCRVCFSVCFFATVLAMSFLALLESFKGDVRVFFGAPLWLLCPSLAWCFPVREPCFGLPCFISARFLATVLPAAGSVVSSFSLAWCFPVPNPM